MQVQPDWPLGALPFVALLLAIAVLPLIKATRHWWESNLNKGFVACGCGALTLLFIATHAGTAEASETFVHAIAGEYIPFVVLLGSLFVVAGGIHLRSDVDATPSTNTLTLAIGAILASVIGTTGASMLLIRLLIDANRTRTRSAHTIVFFIFVVSNIGGVLLPIGDPPLFLGYLKGIPFFWTLNLFLPWLVSVALVLTVYFMIDSWMARRELASTLSPRPSRPHPLQISGVVNFVWLGGILASVIVLVPGEPLIGTQWITPAWIREGAMASFLLLSLATTSTAVRRANLFSWAPIVEVAVLFFGIFLAVQVPLEVLSHRGADLAITTPVQFFWITGLLSSVLDNAPTYLVFLTISTSLPALPGDAMVALSDGSAVSVRLLVAISLGAVFMGANTYIGNGPNFMVKAIAEERGIKMPSFFGYLGWSCAVLIPLFVIVTYLFVR